MRKKAQYSRKDMAVLYLICLALVFISVGTLYQIGILGDIKDSLNGNSGITAAVVVEDKPQEDNPLVLQTDNQTDNSSHETDT